MKKLLPLFIIVVLLLAAGTGIYLGKHKSSSTTMTPTSPTPQKSQSVFSSIQDALSKSLSLSCDFTDAQGTHVIAYVKNGEIRSDFTGKTAQESGSVLVKDKKLYFWNATMGMMMDMSTITPVPTQSGATGASNGQNTLATLEQYKKYCKPAIVSDSLFILPTNVKFTDASQMMHAMPTVSQNGTGGYAIPTEYQQYMPH